MFSTLPSTLLQLFLFIDTLLDSVANKVAILDAIHLFLTEKMQPIDMAAAWHLYRIVAR
ncbi:MAG: hypothetical protein IPM82_20725 [Saprospiraceae bacterium]|nr:hypothetical protein [Saprospiraceae bacterium]